MSLTPAQIVTGGAEIDFGRLNAIMAALEPKLRPLMRSLSLVEFETMVGGNSETVCRFLLQICSVDTSGGPVDFNYEAMALLPYLLAETAAKKRARRILRQSMEQGVPGAAALADILEPLPAKSSTETGVIGYASLGSGICGLVIRARCLSQNKRNKVITISGSPIPLAFVHPCVTGLHWTEGSLGTVKAIDQYYWTKINRSPDGSDGTFNEKIFGTRVKDRQLFGVAQDLDLLIRAGNCEEAFLRMYDAEMAAAAPATAVGFTTFLGTRPDALEYCPPDDLSAQTTPEDLSKPMRKAEGAGPAEEVRGARRIGPPTVAAQAKAAALARARALAASGSASASLRPAPPDPTPSLPVPLGPQTASEAARASRGFFGRLFSGVTGAELPRLVQPTVLPTPAQVAEEIPGAEEMRRSVAAAEAAQLARFRELYPLPTDPVTPPAPQGLPPVPPPVPDVAGIGAGGLPTGGIGVFPRDPRAGRSILQPGQPAPDVRGLGDLAFAAQMAADEAAARERAARVAEVEDIDLG